MRTTLVLGLLWASPAVAAERDGLWFGLGLGAGANTLADEAIAGKGALLGDFRLGYAVHPQVLIGGELGGFGQYNKWEEARPLLSSQTEVLATAWFFPMADLPLHASVGVGWASALKVRRGPDFGGDTIVGADGANGLAWLVGLGGDFVSNETTSFGARLRYDGALLPALDLVTHGGALELVLNGT